MTTLARKGYYAPKQLSDPAETAKVEIREALFSREELNELPVDLKSEFVKKDEKTAVLTLLAHVEVNGLRYRKVDGRNHNTLTITIGIFDRNGNHVTGVQKIVEMKLKDERLAQSGGSGLTLRSPFEVAPGTYLMRLVVRDSEGQQMSAQNGAIEIP